MNTVRITPEEVKIPKRQEALWAIPAPVPQRADNTTMETINYELDAKTKLAQCGGHLSIRLSNSKDAPWGGVSGEHYRFSLTGPGGTYHSDFWGSRHMQETKTSPTTYDVLACLVKSYPGTFEDFCSEFGYSEDSRQARKTWKACRAQYAAFCRVFPSETARQLLAEIA